MHRPKYIRYTDTHLNSSWPWSRAKMVREINRERPSGLFLTGDISSGVKLESDLSYLAHRINCPIYFVLGNHDMHLSSFSDTYLKVRNLCAKYPNLHWMTESGVISLTKKAAVIGTEGWYDGLIGNPEWLTWTPDWLLIREMRGLSSHEERLAYFRTLAKASADLMERRLEEAFQQHKVVYLLTHFPPWKEATRDEGTLMESFWLPYNVNYQMGQMIERVMETHKKKRLVVLAGHVHSVAQIWVRHNVECIVDEAHYTGSPKIGQRFFI